MKSLLRLLSPEGFLWFGIIAFTASDRASAQWVQTGGPYGGVVHALAVEPAGGAGTNIFAGAAGGAFRSSNNGAHWTPVSTGPTSPQFYCFAVSPRSGGGYDLFAGTDGGIFLSTNDGGNWAPANSGLTNNYVLALAVSPDSPGRLFAGTYGGGVFLSTDNGANWNQANDGLTNQNVFGLAVSSDGSGGTLLFAGTDGGGVFLSTDEGAHWHSANAGMTNLVVDCFAVDSGGSVVYAGTGGGGVFRTTDNGANWGAANAGMTSANVYDLVFGPNGAGGTNLYAGAAASGVFRSTDNGVSWSQIIDGLPPYSSVYALAACPDGAGDTNLFAGTIDGVFISTNHGTSWTAAVAGFSGTSPFSFAAIGTDLVAGTDIGVFLSDNNGASWRHLDSGWTNRYVSALAVIVGRGTSLFAGSYGGVFRSTDTGGTWTLLNSGLTNSAVLSLAVAPDGISGSILVAGTYGGGIFHSTDGGANWVSADSGLTDSWVPSLAVDGTTIFAGTHDGVFRSTDHATSWTRVSNGLTNTYILSLAVMPGGGGSRIFAGTFDGVFVSSNDGASWTQVNAGLTYTFVYSLAVRDNLLFAGTPYGGVFLSTNYGESWTAVNSGLANATVNALIVGPPGPGGVTLYAGLQGGGVWGRPLSDLISYTITATAGVNGVISPSGSIPVGYGSTQAFTILPDAGHYVDSVIVDGIAVDSSSSYTFANVTSDHTIRCTFRYPPVGVSRRWNIVSLPLAVSDSRKSQLFPTAISNAFAYEGSYLPKDSLVPGKGYWLKFENAGSIPISGDAIALDSLDLVEGWNLIGSISAPVAARMISSNPPGLILSEFFGYRDGYIVDDTIRPGRGYWVKSDQAGQLFLSSSGSLPAKTRIRILRGTETPPPPPDGPADVIVRRAELPTEYELGQNFPNPFNPVTSITYGLPEAGAVSLVVYTMLGQEVQRLADGEQSAGYHTVIFDASQLSSGLYFYELTTVRSTLVKKMMILR